MQRYGPPSIGGRSALKRRDLYRGSGGEKRICEGGERGLGLSAGENNPLFQGFQESHAPPRRRRPALCLATAVQTDPDTQEVEHLALPLSCVAKGPQS